VNDILVATTRPNLNAVAKVENEHAGFVASTGFCVLRPNEEIDPDFLFFFTQSEPFIEKLCKGVNGAMYPAVNDSWLFR
jgi:type I restriction enzyme S subunit